MKKGIRLVCWCLLPALLWAAPRLSAMPIVLYDQSVGETPDQQDWFFYGQDTPLSGGLASQSPNPAGGVDLTTDAAVSAGYANQAFVVGGPGLGFKNPLFPDLDANAGFRLDFQLAVRDEVHVSDHRAGFSVVLLDHLHQGIELGFWADTIWAQADDPLFTHAEEALFDTSVETLYSLIVSAGGYRLQAGGSTLLRGALRDYSAFGGAPYTLGNLVFFGDDTSSASAAVTLGRVTIRTGTTPAPAVPALLTVGLVLLGVQRGRYRHAMTQRVDDLQRTADGPSCLIFMKQSVSIRVHPWSTLTQIQWDTGYAQI